MSKSCSKKHSCPGVIVLSLVLVAITVAGQSDSQLSEHESSALPYEKEAEQMAMYYSGELRGPRELTERISRELWLIRETWQDSLPAVKMAFRVPWQWRNFVIVHLDFTAYHKIQSGSNQSWDSLNEQLGLISEHCRGDNHSGSTAIVLRFDDNLHPHRVAEIYAGFPGVLRVQTESIPLELLARVTLARTESGDFVKYYFKEDCAPDIYFTYYYFVLDGDTALFVGKHAECFEDQQRWMWAMGQFGWRTMIPLLDAYQDSLEVNRLSWVDTVRRECRFPDSIAYFSPDRPK